LRELHSAARWRLPRHPTWWLSSRLRFTTQQVKVSQKEAAGAPEPFSYPRNRNLSRCPRYGAPPRRRLRPSLAPQHVASGPSGLKQAATKRWPITVGGFRYPIGDSVYDANGLGRQSVAAAVLGALIARGEARPRREMPFTNYSLARRDSRSGAIMPANGSIRWKPGVILILCRSGIVPESER
jgi:hypothetical protein